MSAGTRPQPAEPGAGVAATRDDCRCFCGSLLARVTERGVELKCRRCKRTLLVPLPEGGRRSDPVEVVSIASVGEVG